MKKLIFLILCSLLYNFANSVQISLVKMVVESDIIIKAKLISSSHKYYVVKVIDQLKGEQQFGYIRIKKYSPVHCMSEQIPYKKGQKEIFFLQNIDKKTWKVMGYEEQARFLIRKGKLAYENIFGSDNRNCKEVRGFRFDFCGWVYNESDFYEAVLLYLDNFQKLKERFVRNNLTTANVFNNKVYKKMVEETAYYLAYEKSKSF